ncbi:MAG: hypothetical protein ACKO24_14845 [Leptolyngbyaceae cyanobacterium]
MRPFYQSEATLQPAPTRPTAPPSPVGDDLLHPALQSVLSNVDVELEAELARYRRASIQTGKVPGRRGMDHNLGLMALLTGHGQSQIASESSTAPPPFEAHSVHSEALPLTKGPECQAPIPAITPNQALPQLKVSGLLSNGDLAVSPSVKRQSELTTNTSDVPLSPSTSVRLDGYLESSEELLRSLKQEETEIHSEQQFMKSLLTPLGMGSMALLLFSSAAFGYVLMNPSTLSQLLAFRLTGLQTPSGSQAIGPAPVPNLAAQEFKDVNLRSLGSLAGGKSGRSATLGPSPSSGGQAQSTQITPSPKPMIASGMVGAAGTETIAAAGKATATVNPPANNPAAKLPSSASESVRPERPATPAVIESPPVRRSYPAAARQPDPPYSYNPPTRPAPASARPRSVPPVPKASVPVPVSPGSVMPNPPVSVVAPPKTEAAKPSVAADSLRYKVVTPFENDRALESARQAVPDAYVRNTADGAKVQLGAYTDAKAAEARAEELRKQGIPAEVYNP